MWEINSIVSEYYCNTWKAKKYFEIETLYVLNPVNLCGLDVFFLSLFSKDQKIVS